MPITMPARDGRDDGDRQKDPGDVAGHPLGHRQIRHPPHQREDRDGELGAHVGEETQSGTRSQPHRLDAGQGFARWTWFRFRRRRPPGVFCTRTSVRTIDMTPSRGHRNVGGGPARSGEDGEEGDRREHLAELSADSGQLRDQRNLPGREPVRHQAQHGDESERVAQAEHRARGNGGRQGLGERQHELARRHQRGTRDDERLGAESVEQQTGRDLRSGVDDDLQHDECRQHAGAGVETVRRVQAGDTQRGAVENGHDVGEESGGPDDPGTHAEPFITTVHLDVRRLHRPAPTGSRSQLRGVNSLTSASGRRPNRVG